MFLEALGNISPVKPASSTIDHYDLISQYRDNNNFVSPSQNEQSARWAGGPGSRTMPSLSPGQYYNFQGQNSQFGWDVQQGRKYSQAYGARGYPSPHHSQMGASREHLEQILRDRTLGNVLDYQDLRHSQTGAVRGYQEQILRDRTVGNSEVPRYSQSHQLWDSDMSSPRNS
ncbi:hypothetical protein IFM89_016514 [Coptis chinensis]|uniref:Uncharacterized protein n=1 Tax=Coptis chinensis TaxID=261450 RepID=A0A835ILC4_9MAGN|nr:hypothetical protein IFM89_016514 [Coptis chinensis]